jgi:hypothetical protein
MPEAATVTIPNVEIVRVGKWAASTGPVTVTPEDIADAVAASKDPEVDKGPLRFGHTGALSNLGDSTPAFGWLDNLALTDDGQTVTGDLVDVPTALAPAIKAAFKRRSAELAWGVKTVGGKSYRMVIDGLALLGVQPPAVKGMADLAALYDSDAAPVTLATSKLSADSHTTLSLYDVPTSPDEPTIEERIANALRWAKTAAAELAAVAGIKGLDTVFAALEAMAVPDSRGLLSGDPHHDPVPTPAHGGTMPESTLKPEELAKARTLLGLADDATDEQVTAKLTELGDLVTAGKPSTDPEPEPAAALAAAVKIVQDNGMSIIADSALETIKADAAAGRQAATHLAAAARDTVLDDAERLGKFGAGEAAQALRTNLAASLEKDFDGTKAVIDALPAIVPVGELGSSIAGPDHSALSAAAGSDIDAELRELLGDEYRTAKEA